MNVSILPVETIGCYVVVSTTFVALDGRSVVPPCTLGSSSLLMRIVVMIISSGCPSMVSSKRHTSASSSIVSSMVDLV